MRICNLTVVAMLVLGFVAVAGVSAHAQTYSVLYNFGSNSGDPAMPRSSGIIAQGRDGNLYSTSQRGGAHNYGAVFRISPAGRERTLYSFNKGVNGGPPSSGLTLGTDDNFYGTTTRAIIFKVSPSGHLTRLYRLANSSGANLIAPPIQGTDGDFYGTANAGGDMSRCEGEGCGTIYKFTPTGEFTTLYQFDGTHGEDPQAPLVEGTDGEFYGTTYGGGAYGVGVVFKITRTGKLTVLHDFGRGDGGGDISSPLVQGSDGNFYGTSGSTSYFGWVFEITPDGSFTVLYDMNGTTDGNSPAAGLVQATDGNFLGVDQGGGSSSNCSGSPCGTFFTITPAGAYSVLYNFDNTSGAFPSVTPLQHTNGFIYGDTAYGGSGNAGRCTPGACGVFYSMDVGLKPFVTFVGPLSSGKVGKTIQILGQGFTGTTAVSFNGTAASFIVKSDTYLTAVVPGGATTGFVTVTTPGGLLTSNKQFRVKP